jgi:hypothetical protein
VTRPTAAEVLAAFDGRALLLVLGILACVVAVGVILARGNPDAEARIRDEWAEANGPDAPRPWGSDRGSAPIPWGVVICAALLLLALGFAASQGDKATTSTCDLPVQSEC